MKASFVPHLHKSFTTLRRRYNTQLPIEVQHVRTVPNVCEALPGPYHRMAESDGFVLVKHKKTGERHNPNKVVQCSAKSPNNKTLEENDSDIDYDRLTRKISALVEQLKSSEFYRSVFDQLKKCCSSILKRNEGDCGHEVKKDYSDVDVDTASAGLAKLTVTDNVILPDHAPYMECVCYGVGSIASCMTAQYQLALCMALRDDLELASQLFSIYDPVFTEGEKKLLMSLKFDVIDVNEEGKRACCVPTVFFLPHCGKALYNNLLWRNWDQDRLQNIVIIGNSFSAMIERTPERILKETGSYILKIHSYTTEIPLDVGFHPGDIFNDMSIHYFPHNRLRSVPSEMWESCAEPVYTQTDAEIVLRDQVLQ